MKTKVRTGKSPGGAETEKKAETRSEEERKQTLFRLSPDLREREREKMNEANRSPAEIDAGRNRNRKEDGENLAGEISDSTGVVSDSMGEVSDSTGKISDSTGGLGFNGRSLCFCGGSLCFNVWSLFRNPPLRCGGRVTDLWEWGPAPKYK